MSYNTLEKRREYRLANKDRHNQNSRDWYAKNKDRRREYLKSTLNRRRIITRAYYLAHKVETRAYQNMYELTRKSNDPNYMLGRRLRDRLRTALRRQFRVGSAVQDLGCSINELKLYLENQFDKGMTWDNYGKMWEIDHVIPLCNFDLTDRMQLLEACNWLNLRPLTVAENRGRIRYVIGTS